MLMIRRLQTLLLVFTLFALSGCGEEYGPGMTVTWRCLDQANEIWLKSIRYPSGLPPKRSTSITIRSPATEGFAPDDRVIPKWVELSWIEPKDYENYSAAPPIEEQLKAIHQLPVKTQLVQVGSRIPRNVVAQAMEAAKNQRRGELPDKHIWIYFTWHQGQVSFRWELLDRTLQPGGKVIAAGS